MIRIKAVLFDVIGTTIIETNSSLIADCLKHAFRQHQVEISDAEIESIRGKDKLEAIQLLLLKKNHDPSHVSSILDAFKTHFRKNLHQFSEAEDLIAAHAFLWSNRIYVGVGTGLPQDLFQLLFEYFKWSRFNFDYVGVAEKVGRGRPHPDMINDMCAKLKIGKRDLLKIGDTPSDIEEGKNAGVYTAAILRGTVPDQILFDTKPDFIFRSLHEITTILE